MATNVPLSFVDNDGRNEMKRSYIKLILNLERLFEIPEYKPIFSNFFSVPTHQMIHMFDMWKSVGSFRDCWCFFTERCCCTVRKKLSPHKNSFKTTQNQMPFLAIDNCKSIYK